MEALLYRRGGLGDTLLTFPLLEILTRKGYRVTAVGNTDYLKIARAVGWADRVLPELPEESFDLKILISHEGNVPPFPKERIWVVEHYLKHLGMLGEHFSRTLPLSPLRNSPFRGKVVLHPSSGSPKKNPDLSLFLKLEEYLEGKGFESVYLIGEADRWLEGRVDRKVVSHDPLWIGRSLKEALLFVGLDSGISHLASYLGVPAVVIYGPTDPLTWRPVGSRIYQIHLRLACAPCFPEVCPERICLEESRLLKELLPLLDHLLVQID